MEFPWWLSCTESACHCRRHRFDPCVGKMPWRRKWQPTPVFLTGESHRWRSLAGYSLRGHKESDTTEQRHFTSLEQYRLTGCNVSLQSSVDSKESTCNVGDTGSIPWSVRSPGEGNGDPFQYFCLKNSKDKNKTGGLQFMGSQRGRYD